MVMLFVIILVLLCVILGYFVMVYNRIQSLRNGEKATLSQIRVAMKKRLDMIEQLVESVSSYAKFERNTLEDITRLRRGIGSADTSGLKSIEGESRELMGSIQAIAEGYPDLKTSDVVLSTMKSIKEMEDEISRHRYTYNNIILEHNTILDRFPSNLLASWAHLAKMDYLNFEEDELRRQGYLTDDGLEPSRPKVAWE